MEIEIEPTFFQLVTWKVRDFFELPQKNDDYLDSPKFFFNDDSYRLRLFPRVKRTDGDKTEIYVRRLGDALSESEVFCRVGIMWRERNGDEYYDYVTLSSKEHYFILRSWLEENRDEEIPDVCLTVSCCMWLSEESRAGSSTKGEEERGDFLGHNASFSSRWNAPEMELSTESPCTHVELTVPKFFELPREVVDSLTSPEFRFAGDTYCFRFRPNEDTDDTDLQLVRLTSSFPERTVCYRIGYRDNEDLIYSHNSRSLAGKIGVCCSRSILEEERGKYVIDGTLGVLLFLRLGERSSGGPGTSDAAQMRSELTGIHKLQSQYRQVLQKGTESDACVIVCEKEFPVHRVVLRARSTVFDAMFGHDTTEKESGRVVVDDLDPDTFGDFLEYLYTGDVQAGLSDDNAFGLYAAADKYDVATLRSECVEYMRRTLSVDSFCDVVSLALRHREDDLLQQSVQFFKDNLPGIIITVKWQQFMCDNPTSANEMFIKALVPRKQ